MERYTVSITSISLETLRPTVNHRVIYIQSSNVCPDFEHISTVRIEITSDGIDAKFNEIQMNMPQGLGRKSDIWGWRGGGGLSVAVGVCHIMTADIHT